MGQTSSFYVLRTGDICRTVSLSQIGKSLLAFGDILLRGDFYSSIFVSGNLNRNDYENKQIFDGNDVSPLPAGGSGYGFRFG